MKIRTQMLATITIFGILLLIIAGFVIATSKATANLFVILLIGVFSVFVLISYLLFYGRILRSIEEMQKGAEIVGSGNLEFTIVDESPDEIGDLSRSFNRMTTDLKRVTASKTELEQEIIQRKNAEEALAAINTELSAANEELTAAQDELHHANASLAKNEADLRKKNDDLSAMNEELSSAQEELIRSVEEVTKTRDRLQVASAQRQLALDAAKLGWWFYDPVSKISRYDQRYREIFEVTGDEKPNDEILASRIHPDDLPGLWAKVEASLDPINPKPYAAEYRIKVPGGKIKWIEAHGIVSFEGSGASRSAVSFVGTVEDVTEKRNAAETLKESEGKLKKFYESGLIGVIYWNMDGAITEANDKFLAMTGYSREDLAAGKINWADMTPPEYRDRDKESMQELKERGANREPFEKEYFRKDGTRIPVLVAGAMMDTERHTGVAIVSDITIRKQAQAALKESEERLRSLYSSMIEGIAVHEIIYNSSGTPTDYRIIEVNPAFSAITGISKEAGIGALASSLYGTGSAPYLDRYARVAETGVSEDFDTEFEPMKKSFHISVFSPAKGRFATVFTDITERKRAEAALQESEERFRVIAQTSPVLLSVSSLADGKVLFVNPAYERTFGFDHEEIIGKNAEDLFYEAADREKLVGTLVKEKEIKNLEVRVKRKDGSPFWISASFAPIQFGGTNAILGASIDISSRKEVEQAFRSTFEQLRTLVSSLQIGILLVGDNIVELVNQTFCDYFRLSDSPEKLKGITAAEMLAKIQQAYRDPSKELARINEIVRQGIPVLGEEIPMWGGRTYLRSFIPITLEGTNLGRLWYHVDITDRILAEAAAREAQARTAAILEQIAETFYSLDEQWRFTVVNHAAEKAPFGRPASEMLGKIIWDLYPRLVGTPIHQHYIDALEKKTLEHYEAQSPLDGRWYEVFMQGRKGCLDVYMRDITTRRQAEEALRESEMKFKTVADFTADWEYWQAPDKKFIYISPSVEEITGYLPQEFMEDENLIDAIIYPQDRSLYFEHMERCTAHSDPSVVDFRIVHRNGSIRWIGHKCRPVFSPTGIPLGRRVSNRDITSRKSAEETLRETSDYLEKLITHANAPIVIWDRYLRITRFNHAFEVLTGRPAEEVIGNTIDLLFPPKFVEPAMNLVRRAMAGEQLRVVEIPILNQSGETRIVLWNSATLTGPDGKTIESTIAQGQDITERKKAEAKLTEIAEKYSTLFNTTSDGVWIHNLEGIIVEVNDAYCRMTGYTSEELIGKSVSTVEAVETPSEIAYHIKKLVTSEGHDRFESKHRRKDGTLIDVDITALYIPRDGGRIAIFARDITDRKHIEEALRTRNMELNALNLDLTETERKLQQTVSNLTESEAALRHSEAELKEALEEKEVLLSEIHHRVKNNLTAFISLLSLEGAYDSTPAGNALKTDLQNRARSMALIHETLYRTKKYARVEMDVYLSTLIAQVSGSYESHRAVMTHVDAHGITLDLSRATTCGLIINEILTNSLKYAFPSSFNCLSLRGAVCKVEVLLAQENGMFTLTVRDNGIGLPQGLDITTTKTLGLKLVNFLAKHQLRANITVNSIAGTEFLIQFGETLK